MDVSGTSPSALENENVRLPLTQQSAQCVIVDLSSPMTDSDLSMISECLLRVLPAVCVLPGPPRVPVLGVLVCNNNTGITEEVRLLTMSGVFPTGRHYLLPPICSVSRLFSLSYTNHNQ